MNTTATEYVRLLRAASTALQAARTYAHTQDPTGTALVYRPVYADLVTMETLDSQEPTECSWWCYGPVDDALVKLVEAKEMVELFPPDYWEYIDEDISTILGRVGCLAEESDEVCGGCGKRWPEGSGEVIECDNDGCTGTCPDCQNEPCPHHEPAVSS